MTAPWPGLSAGPAREDEAPELAAILAGADFRPAYGAALPEPETVIRRALQRGVLLVARDEGRPAGFVWLETSGTFGCGGYIRLIAVAPAARGRGVGTLLIQEAERAIFAESPHAFLLTSDFNQGAQRFYQRLGWRHVGELPGFVREGIAELIFWKRRPRF